MLSCFAFFILTFLNSLPFLFSLLDKFYIFALEIQIQKTTRGDKSVISHPYMKASFRFQFRLHSVLPSFLTSHGWWALKSQHDLSFSSLFEEV